MILFFSVKKRKRKDMKRKDRERTIVGIYGLFIDRRNIDFRPVLLLRIYIYL